MGKISVTRLRYVSSKDPEIILAYLNKLLGYKVEIKGNPTFVKGKWFVWFVLPENDILKESASGDLD